MNQKSSQQLMRMLGIAAVGQTGCVTVVIALGALAIGLWLDGQFNTKPLFTLCLLGLSIPANIFFVWRLALNLIKRTVPPTSKKEGDAQ
ncbi:MAG: AtpZ/AtpI family protein [Aggregatilineales bacterium]